MMIVPETRRACALNWISSFSQERRDGIPLTSLTWHFCEPIPSQDLHFKCHESWSFYMFCECVIAVDIGEIDDHHCLNLIFIIIHLHTVQTGRWVSPGPPVSPSNETDHHDITEILLKVALNTINLTNNIPSSHHHLSPCHSKHQ